MIIAIDFDGTIVSDKFPHIAGLQPDARKCINQLRADGHYIIIWTCRYGNRLLEAINFLVEHDVKFDRVNDHQPDNLKKYGGIAGKKIFADIYIDDRQVGGLPSWSEIYDYITGLQRPA